MAATGILSGVVAKYYKAKAKLGAGAYGQVWEVEHRSTQKRFALKVMERDPRKYHGNAEKELSILMIMKQHPNIVPWYAMLLAAEMFHYGGGFKYQTLAMELCDTDLAGYLKKYFRVIRRQLDRFFDIAQQIIAGVVFLHTHQPEILHRDIKPQNILVKLCPNNDKVTAIKLSDFGLSNTVELDGFTEDPVVIGDLENTVRNMKTTVAGRGTLPFMAPEFFAAKNARWLAERKFRVDASVDVFATGLVFAYTFGYNSGDYYGK